MHPLPHDVATAIAILGTVIGVVIVRIVVIVVGVGP
jgi:hypothetical protein